jgi:hypothetical protein
VVIESLKVVCVVSKRHGWVSDAYLTRLGDASVVKAYAFKSIIR